MNTNNSIGQFGYTLNLNQSENLLNIEEIQVCERYFEDLSSKMTKFAIGLYSLGKDGFLYLETDDFRVLNTSFSNLENNPEIENVQLFRSIKESIESQTGMNQVFYCQGYKKKLANKERIATFMRVKKGKEGQYRFEHQHVWESILLGIERVHIQNYSIFMDNRDLFSFFEVENLEDAMNSLTVDLDNQKWQAHMVPLMDVGSGIRDSSSVYMNEILFVEN